MAIKDKYRLKRSNPFVLSQREEVTVNLSLSKAPIKPCTLLLGSINGKNGQIKGATVKVFDYCFNPIEHTVTDEKGCFAFENSLPSGDYFVMATADNYAVSEACRVLIFKDVPVSICIWLSETEKNLNNGVYGIAYDQANKKLPYATISISEEASQKKLVATTQTNEDGEYVVYGLKAGKYQISAFKEGYFFPQSLLFEIFPKEYTLVNIFLYAEFPSIL